MIILENLLREKKRELEQLIESVEKRRKGSPQGSLITSKVRKGYSYYHYLSDQREKYPKGKYISRKEKDLITALAQKEYDEKILRWARACCGKLEGILGVYRDDMCVAIYENLAKGKGELVVPYQLPEDLFAQQWQDVPYSGKEMNLQDTYFITEKNERVRSKSEKILADHFYRKGIPYRYEFPLLLNGYGTVYPDFTLLNKRTREEFYWEHLGMMDNPEYVQKAIMKIHSYEQNGIFPGKGLLLSYEVKNDLNMEAVDALVQEFLI